METIININEIEEAFYINEGLQKYIPEDIDSEQDYQQEYDYTSENEAVESYLLNCEDIPTLQQALKDEKLKSPFYNLTPIEEAVLCMKTTQESFCRFNDRNHINFKLAKMFFKKGSRTLDQIALEDFDEAITPNEIAETMLILANDNSKLWKTTELYWKIRARIKELKLIEKEKSKASKIKTNIIKVKINSNIVDKEKKLIEFCKKNNINLNIIGKWKWLDNTKYEQKEEIKSFGFYWSAGRRQWYRKY